MTTSLTFSILRIAWFTWALFWIWSARGTKGTARREAIVSRVFYLLFIAAALVVMFINRIGVQVIPRSPAMNVAAVILTWAGVLFSIWARALLGRNWSASVTLKQEHELITTGPYRVVRNPIYSGLLLAGAGAVVALGSLEAIAGYLMVSAALAWKSRIEQRLLAAHFGAAYREYSSRTKLLIPYIL